MTDAVEAAVDAPLSVDQAIESLLAPPEDETNDAQPEAAAEDVPEADPNPAEDASEAEEPGDGEEAAEETEAAAEPVEAPQWWDAEAKAKFAALSPDLQAIVRVQEDKRESVVAKAKQEAAEARKAAEQDVAGVRQLADKLAEFLPKAVETFQQQWGEPDWKAVIEQYGVEEYAKLRVQHDDHKAQLEKLAEAKREADAKVRAEALREENEKLKGTPLEAVEARQEVAKYLMANGYSRDAINDAMAQDFMLAHKAMLYDKAQEALKAKPPKPATPAPAKAPARPAAALPGTSQTRSAQQLANRYAQTRSIDDAVALLVAQGKR